MGFKDYLEGLEIGDDKLKLSKEQVKAIIAESGKVVNTEVEKAKNDMKTEIDGYKNTITDLNEKIKKAPSSDELESLKNQVASYEKQENERIEKEKATKADQVLTNNILAVFGDKQFTSDYAKNGLLQDIKTALKKDENQGKGIKELCDELTANRTDIFVNPNQIADMPPMGDVDTGITQEVFDKMSYLQRVELKQSNPELFKKFNN